jgi:hypothetical protein
VAGTWAPRAVHRQAEAHTHTLITRGARAVQAKGGLIFPDKATIYIAAIEDGDYRTEKIDCTLACAPSPARWHVPHAHLHLRPAS